MANFKARKTKTDPKAKATVTPGDMTPGDRVQFVDDEFHPDLKGKTGEVVHVDTSESPSASEENPVYHVEIQDEGDLKGSVHAVHAKHLAAAAAVPEE